VEQCKSDSSLHLFLLVLRNQCLKENKIGTKFGFDIENFLSTLSFSNMCVFACEAIISYLHKQKSFYVVKRTTFFTIKYYFVVKKYLLSSDATKFWLGETTYPNHVHSAVYLGILIGEKKR
jgi:hypothetical protein